MGSDNPRGQQATEISSAFSGIALLVVCLRLYTRFFIVRYSGVEDYLVILSMLCSLGLSICIGIQAQYGMGKHLRDLTQDDMQSTLKAFFGSLIVYNLGLGVTKSALVLQYRRVFPTRKFGIACWCVMAIVLPYTLWTVLGSIFSCDPIRAFWTKEPAKCLDQFAMWFTNAALNIVTDLAIIILPMPVIRQLNLARRQKQALFGIFAVGGFVCVISILRLQSLVAISNSSDPTYDNPPAATWSSVELNIGIICSCLPCLRPLITRCLPGVFSSHNKQSAFSGPTSFSRNTYGRQISVGANEIPLEPKRSRGSSEADNGNDKSMDIQVVTDIHISVDHRPAGAEVERESSTETLVRDTTDIV